MVLRGGGGFEANHSANLIFCLLKTTQKYDKYSLNLVFIIFCGTICRL